MIILELWTEKYAPQDFNEIVGYNHNFEQQLDNLPHYLFYGSPGIGKTATAKVIIKKLNADYLTLNSSVDRKIEVLRGKVKDFVTTASSNNNVKIVHCGLHVVGFTPTFLQSSSEIFTKKSRISVGKILLFP